MASSSMRDQSRAASASAGTNQEPPTQATFAMARKSGAFCALMPPVGQKRTSPKGPAQALSIARPPACSAGKNLSSLKPASCARMISDAVATPGSKGRCWSPQAWATRSVKPGLTAADVEQILRIVSVEHNIRDVGTLPLSKELEVRSGKKEPILTIYQFCSPTIARRMADFSPHMAAYMPCRVALVERPDGLWLYTLNMDMMVKMGRKLPSPLKEEAWSVRQAMWEMMERASKGEF